MDDSETALPPQGGAPWWAAAFDASYAARYAHRDDTEANRALDTFLASGALTRRDRVLDLCCGGGRHLASLAARGITSIGLDYSLDLLALARGRASGAPLIRGDMRALPFRAASFDAVLHMFTAFGYFEDDRENEAVLREVARVLRPGGRYLLDLFNAAPTIAALAPEHERVLPDGSIVRESRRFDAARRRVEKKTTTTQADRRTEFTESVRCFAPAELDAWLERSGFVVADRFGDYSGATFSATESPRMITVARARS